MTAKSIENILPQDLTADILAFVSNPNVFVVCKTWNDQEIQRVVYKVLRASYARNPTISFNVMSHIGSDKDAVRNVVILFSKTNSKRQRIEPGNG